MLRMITICLTLVTLSGCGSSASHLPDGIIVYESSIRSVPIHFEDQSVLDRRENGYQLFMIFKIKDKGLVAPIFYMRMPMIGGGSRMKHLDVIRAAGNTQDHLYIADDPSIEKLVLLVQGIALENRGWRYCEISVLAPIQSVTLPSLETLPLIEELPNHEEIMSLMNAAKETRFELNE